MFCTKCGTQLPDGSHFCGVCGTSLASPVAASASSSVPVPAQTIGYASAQVPASAYPTYASPQNAAKKRSLKVPIAVAALAVVLVAGFFTGWFGLAPGRSISVVTKMTQTYNDASHTTIALTQNEYDARGNRTSSITTRDGSTEGSVSATFDADGFPTTTSVNSGGSTVTVSAVPVKDSSGRVVSITYGVNGKQLAGASFEYEGSTDNITAITYESLSGSGMDAAIFSAIMNMSAAPFVSYAGNTLRNGDDPTRIVFGSDGHLLSYTRGDEVIPVTGLSRDARKSKTIPIRTDYPKLTYTYDDRGNVSLYLLQNSEDASTTVQYERKVINSPSRWAYAAGRLYS